ncbi:copper amine oxidase N-terminal domain-containing protein [Paenibacillus sp. MER 99-2]|uniref:copper amine oxidase N-terminal domain-containing protein n=1 Tax=Paenibacillus sp. MER 99-2 TaxID=2939572 RepID=UPI00203B9416|nr:copper amine oxidase N-terminal domain-containing protein [Paenibacillus sp. MER 99-2]MCM3172434.1 copper amine oxidase N-terminal domain-containing protein [Paenibacillus sp. MER 99-2]
MFKKMVSVWVASVLFGIMALPVLAETSPTEIHTGVIVNNRVLIPLRAVSQHLGAKVQWDKYSKSILLTKNDKKITLAVNFKNANVNDYVEPMDSPVELINATAYVPLRFVSQTLGAELEWNKEAKQANVSLDDRHIMVSMQPDSVQIPDAQKLTEARLNELLTKLNETSDMPENKQIRAYFKPYFTEKLIQSILDGQQLQGEEVQFGAPETGIHYTSSTTATLSQSYVLGNTLTGDSHYVYDRNIELLYSRGIWKVHKLNIYFRDIPYLGY